MQVTEGSVSQHNIHEHMMETTYHFLAVVYLTPRLIEPVSQVCY